VQRLEILLAIFKNRNMELVEEAGRLRRELESAKQQILLMQNSSENPDAMMRVLDEMKRLTIGDVTMPNVFSESFVVGMQTGGPTAQGTAAVSNRGAEFAAEMGRMPIFPGVLQPDPVVGTGSAPQQPMLPCVFSQ
jgi:hypothetical protein